MGESTASKAVKKEARLRAGVIGAGAIAQACHLPGYDRSSLTDLVAFADPDPARHKEMAKLLPGLKGYAHYQMMLDQEKLDVVSVCTPNKYHAAASIAALEAGCHVLCEKPIATTLEEADAMIAAAGKSRKKLMVAFTHRLMEGPKFLKGLAAEKALGKLFMIRARFAHSGPFPGWAKSKWYYEADQAAGGALLDMGIHAIDLCLWLMGPIVSVSAKVATLSKKIEVDDNAVLLLEFKGGALGYIEVGWTSKPGFTGLELYGSEGSIICDYNRGVFMNGGKSPGAAEMGARWRTVHSEPSKGGWPVEIDHWLDVLTGKEKLVMPGKSGRDALEVALAAYASSQTGQRMVIGEKD